MKTTFKLKHTLLITLAVSLSTAMNSAKAGSADHYIPGVFNIRDYLVPEPGLYGGIYNYYYTSGQFNDANGNHLSSVNIRPGPGPGVTLDVKPSLDLYAISPVVIWISPWNLCGIKYGAYIAPSFANASVDAEITSLRGRGVNASNSSLGVGDLFVQPIWLGYTLTNWDFALGYGFYAPIGRYNTVTVNLPVVGPVTTGSPDNIGLGFWTHQLQGAGAWYPWADKRMAVMAALTYQINTQKRDLNVTPGEHLTLNWGISEYLPLKKDNSLLLEVGPAGYDDWQITDDSGGIASDNSRARVHGAGGQLGLTYVPWNAALNFHAFYEYSATARPQGTAYGLSLVFKF
jgi:hypothetical protein